MRLDAATGAAVAVLAALLAIVPARMESRAQAKVDWQGHAALLDYGVVSAGKHTLEELRVGETWRLGGGAITTLQTSAPLITEESVIAPGHYRAWIARPDAQRLQLQLDGAGRWAAAGGDHLAVLGTLTRAEPPSRALEITARPATEQVDPELRALAITVTFGADRLTVPLTIVGGASKKVSGATVDWFKLPSVWLAQRLELAKHTPVATLVYAATPKAGPKCFNVLLAEHEALLVGQETPPTDDNGFGELIVHDIAFDRAGTVAWSDVAEATTHVFVETIVFEPRKSLQLALRTGARRAAIVVALEKPDR